VDPWAKNKIYDWIAVRQDIGVAAKILYGHVCTFSLRRTPRPYFFSLGTTSEELGISRQWLSTAKAELTETRLIRVFAREGRGEWPVHHLVPYFAYEPGGFYGGYVKTWWDEPNGYGTRPKSWAGVSSDEPLTPEEHRRFRGIQVPRMYPGPLIDRLVRGVLDQFPAATPGQLAKWLSIHRQTGRAALRRMDLKHLQENFWRECAEMAYGPTRRLKNAV
jgi:hypothetical protein